MNIIKYIFNKKYRKERELIEWGKFIRESTMEVKQDLEKEGFNVFEYAPYFQLYNFHLDYIESLGYNILNFDRTKSTVLLKKLSKSDKKKSRSQHKKKK